MLYGGLSEAKLWAFCFNRQYIIGEYITDFTCLEAKLVIEIDGGYHSEPIQQESDALRQQWLEK